MTVLGRIEIDKNLDKTEYLFYIIWGKDFIIGEIMSTQNSIFQGNVRVYLQGKNALCPIVANNQKVQYHIGQESTDLIVYDYRKEPIHAAQEAISTHYQNGFSNIFNQEAWADICYEQANEKLEIVLHDPHERIDPKSPILWLGVLEDNIMPDYEVDWELFKPLENGQTAFVSLLPIQRT